MSGSIANLDINVNVQKVKEAIAALDKLAAAATSVEKKFGPLLPATERVGRGVDKQSKSLATLERNLERGARRYEELQRAMNRSGVGDRVRLETQNKLNRAYTEYNKALTSSTLKQHQIAASVRQYENTVKTLNEGLKANASLEKQRSREITKTTKEQARALQDRQKYIRSEADYENRQREKLSADRARYIRTEADYENRVRVRYAKKTADDILSQERALQAARTRLTGITQRADRQLPGDQSFVIRNRAADAYRVYENSLRGNSVGSREAIIATAQFQRSMQGLSGEIARVNGLLPTLNKNARSVSAAFGASNASLGGFSRLLFSTGAALSSIAGALAVREIVQASMEFDRFSNTLKTVSGSVVEYRRNFNYLLAEGDRIGFSVSEVGNSFARMSVAMKGAGFTADQSREAFTNLTEASRNFGISSADTMGIIRALEQSLSKGKFMAEEVRLQMGDRLPIAMAALSAAITKVDGKVSDVSKRFEEGSIDVQRYALEFTKQINTMSGGASALERTSNTIAAAFGRLSNELTRSLEVFKDEGFDAAVIGITKSLTNFIAGAREYGTVALLANAIKSLADNLDLLAVAAGAFATTWLFRIIASMWTFAKNVNAVTVAIRLLAVGLSSLTVYFYNLHKTQSGLAKAFEENAVQINRSLTSINDKVTDVTTNMQQNFQTAATSAESDFQKMQKSLEAVGYTASKALEMTLRAQAEAAKMEVAKMEKELEEAAQNIAGQFELIQGEMFNLLQASAANSKDSLAGQFSAEVIKLLDDVATLKTPLGEAVAELEKLRTKALARSSDELFAEHVNETVNALSEKLKDPTIVSVLAAMLTKMQGLVTAIRQGTAGMAELGTAAANAANGFVPLGASGEGHVTNGVGDKGQLKFDFSSFEATNRRAKAARAFLQTEMQRSSGLSSYTITDTKAVTKAILELDLAIAKGGKTAAGATAIKLEYNRILKGTEDQTKSSKRTLVDYMMEMDGQIAQGKKIVAGYNESNAAGRRQEDTVAAINEVGKYIKPTYDAAGNATGKFAAAVELTIDKKLELEQINRNIAAQRSEASREIEHEMQYLAKEQEFLSGNVHLREEELEVLKKRQELTKDGKVDEQILKKKEEEVRLLVRARRENKHLSDSYEAVARVAESAFDKVADSITDAFARGEISALKFSNIVRALMSDILSQFARLALINPILNSILPTSQVRPTAFAGAGGTDLLSLGSMLGGGKSILESLGLTGAGGLFSTQLISPGPGIPVSYADMGGITTMSKGAGGLSLGGFLGGAGMGLGVGSFLSSITGGNQMGGSIGGALGGGGAALLAAIPGIATALGPLAPLAPLIGGLLGGGLGGLIGPGPSVEGFGLRLQSEGFDETQSRNEFGSGLRAVDRTFYNESGAAMFAQADQLVASVNQFLLDRGLEVGGVSIIGGNKDGADYSSADAGNLSEAFDNLRFRSKDNEGLTGYLTGKTFDDPAKLQAAVEGFLAAQEAIEALGADKVPAFTQQMDAVIAQFDAASEQAKEYGLAEDNLTAARVRALQEMEDTRTETLRQIGVSLQHRRLTAQGMTQEAELLKQEEDARLELKAFEDQLFNLALTAEQTSARLIELEEVQAMERAAIMSRYAETANQEIERAIESVLNAGQSIRQYIDGLNTSESGGLSPQDRLANAIEIFDRDLALARINDVDALGRVTQNADALLEAGRDMFASSPEFQALRDAVIGNLTDLPAVKSYDQRIAEGIELSNELLESQNGITSGILLNTGVGGVATASATLLLGIKQILEATLGAKYEIGSVTNNLIFGITQAVLDSTKVTNDLLFAQLNSSSAFSNATNLYLASSNDWLKAIHGHTGAFASSILNVFISVEKVNSSIVSIGVYLVATNAYLSSANLFASAGNDWLKAIYGNTSAMASSVLNLNISAAKIDTSVRDVNTSLGTVNVSVRDVNASLITIGAYLVAANAFAQSANLYLSSANLFASAGNDWLKAIHGNTSAMASSVLNLNISAAKIDTSVRDVNTSLGTVNTSVRDVNASLVTIGAYLVAANAFAQSANLYLSSANLFASAGNDWLKAIHTDTSAMVSSLANLSTDVLVNSLLNINMSLGTVDASVRDVNASLVTIGAYLVAANAFAQAANEYLSSANTYHAAANTYASSANDWLKAVHERTSAVAANTLVTAGQIQVVANKAHSIVLHIATHQQYTLQGNARLGQIDTAIRELNALTTTTHLYLSSANIYASAGNDWLKAIYDRLGVINIIPNAMGNVVPFANGGVPEFANSPTLAPMALFGEAGPEAIMPLTRTRNGKLGVASSSGGDSGLKEEFAQYRRQSAAETRALAERLDNVVGSVKELATAVNRTNSRGK